MSVRRPPEPSRHQNQSGGLFGNADNTVIYGGNFTSVGSGTKDKSGFQILLDHVAAAAFHNSKQRFNPPRCHKHTREAVLDEIFEWIVGNEPREAWIAWLNGAAGAGKSAICQSIAEVCILHDILVASFFFFRTDSSRNTIDPLVATLAYQIIQLIPETRQHIVDTIELNPLIFEQTFEAQLDMLVVRPLRRRQVTDPAWKLLLIIDGVDECGGEHTQMDLIRVIAKLLRARDLPLIVLFGSRRENQLLMAFNARDMGGILTQLPLDDNYQAEEDILRFLDDSFDEIKHTHPFSASLGAAWPAPDHVQEIVKKSSGQFIYASVVINFLSVPSANPAARLDIIRGLRPSGRLTPFAQLDALYRHIFAQVDDIPPTLEFLAYLIFGEAEYLSTTLHFFDYDHADAQGLLAPLASVLFCNLDADKIIFRHASLPDFLRDAGRSREYCINALATPLAIRWFKTAEAGRFRDRSFDDQNGDIPELLQHVEITDELYARLIAYDPAQHRAAYEWNSFAKDYLTAIRNMDFGDGGKAYNALLNTIVRYVRKEFPENMQYLESEHDVSQVLALVASEEEGARLSPGPLTSAADLNVILDKTTSDVNTTNARTAASSIDSDARDLREIANARAIVGADTPPSPSQGSLLPHPSQPTTRPKIKNWFAKFGHSRTKK